MHLSQKNQCMTSTEIFSIIQEALHQLDIDTQIGSRKDIFYEEYKISGSAFYLKKDKRLHHGTLLIDVDTTALWDVLRFNEDRIESKGISSVKSKVINLVTINPSISIERVIESIEIEYGKTSKSLSIGNADIFVQHHLLAYERIYKQFKSWEWIFGETPKFRYKLDHLGYIDIRDGKVVDAPQLMTFNNILNQPFNEYKILELYQREVLK